MSTNGLWRFLKGILIKNETDQSKTLTLQVNDGATTGKAMVIESAQTDNRTLTLPDATDTLVGKATSDILTNKTIDGDVNTLQDIGISSLKTVLGDANKFLARDVTGAVVSTGSVPTGTIVGTSDSQTLSNKTIDGDDNTVQDLALSSLKTNLTDASKFLVRDASGIVVSNTKAVPTGDVVGTSDTQSLTKKTIVVDGADQSLFQSATGTAKQLKMDLSGATDSKAMTIASSHTDNRTLTLPNATDTLVGRATSDTLTNKTLTSPVISTIVNTGTLTLPTSTDTLVGRATTDTLTNKTLTDPVQTASEVFTQISTPSAPASGKNKLYFKSDDKAYRMNSAGVEQELGSGSGSKNYITNFGAEQDTTGWATFADGAVSVPVDGTGGSPNSTWTRTTSTPLSGAGAFLFTKNSGASRQGEGASYAFTIDNEDQGAILSLEFTYKVASGTFVAGTDTTDSDIVAYIYDTTNNILITPAVTRLYSNSSTAAKFISRFQANSNSTAYRLILMIPNTTNSAFTVQFDSFKVGPDVKTLAPIVQDDQTLPCSLTSFGNAVITAAKFSRVGQKMFGNVRITIGSTVPTGNLAFNFTSHTIDTMAANNCGVATVYVGSVAHLGNVIRSTSTSFQFYGDDGAGIWGPTTPITFANGDVIDFNFIVPIVGWSSQVQMSSDMGASEVSAKYVGTTTTANITNANDADIVFKTKVHDTHNAMSGAVYTVPVSGRYKIQAHALTQSVAASAFNKSVILTVIKNGASTNRSQGDDRADTTNARSYIPYVHDLVDCKAGDTLKVNCYNDIGSGPINLVDDANNCYVLIEKLANPSPILMSEKIVFQARKTSVQATSGATEVSFTGVDYDTHGGFNGTARYTFPRSGYYKISTSISIDHANSATNQQLYGKVNGTGTLKFYHIFTDVVNAKTYERYGECIYKATAGEYFSIFVECDGGSCNINGSGSGHGQTLFMIESLN